MLRDLWDFRQLVGQLVRREVAGRYRGSILGMAWSFVNPLLLLSVYTFFFSVVFGARWGSSGEESRAEFSIMLFAGIIVHGLVAECLARAPGLIVANANYVKKVVFPLQILPWAAMGSALVHLAISTIILLVAQLIFLHTIPWTAVLFPLVMLPLVVGSMGVVWFLSAIGVFLRDISQVTGMLTTILLFLSPVFYPVSRLPEQYRSWLMLNPLTFVIEEARKVLIHGQLPDASGWLVAMVTGLVCAWLGYWWFQRAKRAFADVV